MTVMRIPPQGPPRAAAADTGDGLEKPTPSLFLAWMKSVDTRVRPRSA